VSSESIESDEGEQMKVSGRSALFFLLLAMSSTVVAQAYPAKAIRLLVPSTPGGSVDTLARSIGPRLSERWGQQVIVENRAGAGGAIAAEVTAKSPPDGHTLMLGTIASLAANLSLQKKLSYDPVRDFAPVTLVATQNLMLLIHPSVPAKSVKELVRFAKTQPGKLTFGSAGNGTGSHLGAELVHDFRRRADGGNDPVPRHRLVALEAGFLHRRQLRRRARAPGAGDRQRAGPPRLRVRKGAQDARDVD